MRADLRDGFCAHNGKPTPWEQVLNEMYARVLHTTGVAVSAPPGPARVNMKVCCEQRYPSRALLPGRLPYRCPLQSDSAARTTKRHSGNRPKKSLSRSPKECLALDCRPEMPVAAPVGHGPGAGLLRLWGVSAAPSVPKRIPYMPGYCRELPRMGLTDAVLAPRCMWALD